MMKKRLTMDMLSDEVLILILIKLSSTHLHRYKCVCKRWYALISDQYLMGRYIESHKNSSHHFIIYNKPLSQFVVLPDDHYQPTQDYESNQNIADFSLKFLPTKSIYSQKHWTISETTISVTSSHGSLWKIPRECIHSKRYWTISGSSHGLLLLRQTWPWPTNIMYVYNPLTRQYLELPPLPKDTEHSVNGFTCQPLDPTSSEVEFMVLVVETIVSPLGERTFKFHVFRSKTGKWECFDVPRRLGVAFDRNREAAVVFYNGCFNWSPTFPSVSIVAYDPNNEPNDLRIMRLPQTPHPPHISGAEVEHIGLTEGRMRLITRRRPNWGKTPFFNVYEVTDYDKGIFDLKYQVEQPPDFNVTSKFLSQTNGEIVYLLDWDNKKLMLFNMSDKSQQRTLNLSSICKEQGIYGQAMPFRMTPWPTPIPKLPSQ